MGEARKGFHFLVGSGVVLGTLLLSNSELGILNSTKTPAGFAMLKQWFLRPTLNMQVLQQRHGAIACFMSSRNSHIVNAICKSLTKIKNIPKVLGALRRGKARAIEWTQMLHVGC